MDGSAARRLEKFPAPFSVKVEFETEPVSDDQEQDPSWQNLPHAVTTPLLCFSSEAEQEDTSRMFGLWTGKSGVGWVGWGGVGGMEWGGLGWCGVGWLGQKEVRLWTLYMCIGFVL